MRVGIIARGPAVSLVRVVARCPAIGLGLVRVCDVVMAAALDMVAAMAHAIVLARDHDIGSATGRVFNDGPVDVSAPSTARRIEFVRDGVIARVCIWSCEWL